MDTPTHRLIADVLALPTAPLHEAAVVTWITGFARRRGLPCRCDRWGNLHLRLRQGAGARPVVFEAHLDHPGCELLAGTGRNWTARWLGGHDPRHFPGGRLLIFAAKGTTIRGRVASALHRRRATEDPVFDLRLSTPLADGRGAFGMWDLPALTRRGNRLVTRAADDLAGCAVILATLDRLRRRGRPCDVRAVFTRAEEIGFVGAGGLLSDGLLPRRVPIVVLEASKELPGAVIGGGPVVRVGDRTRVYDPDVEAWLHATAVALARRDRGFRWQRQLMAGGTCEAGLYVCHGYAAGGLALPLGNYHNLGRARPAAEEIGLDDVGHAIRLCAELATASRHRGPPALQRYARRRFVGLRRRLTGG